MTHTVRETGQWQRTLDIEVPVEEVELQLDVVSRRIQRQVAMPGFRKGKVPIDKVRQQFADTVEREFLESFIPEVTGRALREAGLNPIVPPLVQSLRFSPGQPMAFEAVVELTPDVQVKDYKGLPLRRRVRPVDDAAVDAMIQNLREESAIFLDVARPAGKGDMVFLDSQRLDANGRRLSGTRTKGARILLGAPNLNPDLEAGLMGAEEGQERTITVNYPADYQPNPELAGKSMRYIVKVRKIQEKKLRDLDDNFAREVFRLESFEALRERVRQNLEAEDGLRVRRELEGLVTEELVRLNPFDLPPRLVEYMLDRVVHEQTGGRSVSEDLHKQLEEHYRPGVERSLRREILLAGVARQENLSVSAEEISADIDRMAAADPRQASRVRARYQNADQRRALGDTILERKAYDWLIEAARVTDEPLTEPMVIPAGR